jgi:type II secretory pathway pseudopilin PulG
MNRNPDMKRQKGFTTIEILLLLILVALVSFSGYYVYNSQKKTSKTYDAVNSVSNNTPKAADPTVNWKTFSSTDGKFSVKYPDTWVTGSNQANCSDYLMLGTTADTAGHCQSDATPEVAVTSSEGDKQIDYALVQKYYPDLKKVPATINGVQGYKYTGTFHSDQDFGIGPTNGTESVAYIFYTNGRTYLATYNQQPGQPDILADFTVMATKTWQFHE